MKITYNKLDKSKLKVSYMWEDILTKETLIYVKSQAYYDKLIGTIGKDDLYKG